MDDSTVRKIPVDLLQRMDSRADNNPELYQYELLDIAKKRADQSRIKGEYLQVINIDYHATLMFYAYLISTFL